MANRTLAQIERRIDKIKTLLCGIGEMRPGSLTRQFKDRESQTGPYYQLSYTLDLKSRTDYVSNDALADVRRQVANYTRFKELCLQFADSVCKIAPRPVSLSHQRFSACFSLISPRR